MIRLSFSITLGYQVLSSPCDFIFNFHPAITDRQRVLEESLTIRQDVIAKKLSQDSHGSRYLRLQAWPGELTLDYQGIVEINHLHANPDTLHEMPVSELPLDVLTYIYPSRYCQSDKFASLANYEFGSMTPGYHRVMAIRDWVTRRTRFVSGSSGSATSALETLLDHKGVCRDFAHLMIAMCRALNIPARFASGIDYGADPSLGPTDFHAYVEVMLSGRWYLFDPSGVTEPMGLVRLGTGRDAADVAFANVFGNVSATAPLIAITAIVDSAQGLDLPAYTRDALSSTDQHCTA
ncbi:transglutaminase-like domain-containing protein [Pseudohongiella sp.]|uniref:Transglutaminase-like domain-containing protein n=1 Tax=marine sediment metagenome TaxID=412755 RepID=A0A0F9WGH1_9ZZZZ|nr:transglutaminase family protein [Pseudohongiella sp.]HDZ09214.1 transglutaminase family protein [Pseudohongiella sp.]HEA63358.1 transglutaminase family protein [Pseudohongiella sp.]